MKTILVDAVDCFVIVGEGIYQPLHDLLEQYPNPKILLTGANDEQMVTFGLQDMPYELFTLKHNPEKADPAYYQTLLTQYNLTPGDVVYFEHAPPAVESARSVGITTYLYDSEKKDIDALKTFLDANL
jgi:HAD superfamily hydrolase (TIGR01509 family)